MTAVWVENPYAGQGPVLLDLGADSAALVITCPEDLVGSEIGVRRLDEPHSEVGQGHHHVGFGHGDHPGPDHPQIHPHRAPEPAGSQASAGEDSGPDL